MDERAIRKLDFAGQMLASDVGYFRSRWLDAAPDLKNFETIAPVACTEIGRRLHKYYLALELAGKPAYDIASDIEGMLKDISELLMRVEQHQQCSRYFTHDVLFLNIRNALKWGICETKTGKRFVKEWFAW